ncbi:MAG TPA: chemotaxis protein, partial [Pseudomonas sp.]|nr:chemotaxis protein [Pseudomonas sp.]
MKKLNAGNLLAGARSSTLIAALFVVLIVSIVLLFANFAYINTQSNYDTEYISHSGELRVLSQRIAKNATEAAAGTAEAFGLLRDARNDFQQRWGYLTDGDASSGLPPAPESVQTQMAAVQQDWDSLRQNTDAILASEQTVVSRHQVAATREETIPQLHDGPVRV